MSIVCREGCAEDPNEVRVESKNPGSIYFRIGNNGHLKEDKVEMRYMHPENNGLSRSQINSMDNHLDKCARCSSIPSRMIKSY